MNHVTGTLQELYEASKTPENVRVEMGRYQEMVKFSLIHIKRQVRENANDQMLPILLALQEQFRRPIRVNDPGSAKRVYVVISPTPKMKAIVIGLFLAADYPMTMQERESFFNRTWVRQIKSAPLLHKLLTVADGAPGSTVSYESNLSERPEETPSTNEPIYFRLDLKKAWDDPRALESLRNVLRITD
jgi:hypothetical protein